MKKNILSILILTFVSGTAIAAPPTDKYQPGETIDPGCAPGDVNCDIEFVQGDATNDAWVNNSIDGRVELGSKSDGSARDQNLDFVVTDDGKVGIGGFPNKPLSVFGGAHFRGGEFDIFPHANNATTFFDLNNTAVAPVSSHWRIFTGDYTDGSNDGFGIRHFLKSGGSLSRFYIANNGNVGIGTDTPSDGTNNGGQLLKLDVEGAVGATHYCDENGENCSTAASLLNGGGSSDNLGNHTATQNINLSGNYLSGNGGDEGLRIDGNGIVTSLQGNVLRRIAADTSAKDKNITIFGNGLSNFDDGSWFQIHGKDHATQPGVINLIYGGDAGELHIGKRNTASSDRVMTLDVDGHVGIGESNPQSLLDLKGSGNGQNLITLDGDGDNDHEFIGEYNEGIAFGLGGNDITNDNAQMILAHGGQLGIGTVTPGAAVSIQRSRPTLSLGSSDGDDKGMRFEYNETQEQLRIQAVDSNGINWSATHVVFARDTGNVGINTLLPNSKLEVSNGYFELDTSSGQPPAGDCDNADEVGRMKMDEITNDLYVCSASGWIIK